MKYLYVFMLFLLVGCGDEQKPPVTEATPKITQPVIKKKKPVVRKSTQEELAAKLKFTIDNSADAPQKLPEVKFSDDNILEIKNGAGKGPVVDTLAVMPTPANCMARRLQKSNTITVWRPKWNFYGAGTLMIPQVEVNHDKSVIAFVEQFGSQNGPFGSRIVLVNTYSWETIAVHTFNNQKISQIAFGSGANMYCYTDAQPLLKQKSSLFKYNLRSRTTSEEHQYNLSDISYVKGKGLCIKHNESPKMQLIPDEDFSQPFEFSTKNSEGIIATSQSGKILLFGDKKLESFKFDIGWPQRSTPLNYSATNACILGTARQSVSLTKNNQLMLQTKNAFREITNGTNNILFHNTDKNKLIIEKSFKSTIEIYSLPDLLLEDSIIAPEVRPRTKGRALFVNFLPHHDKYILFDSYGHLYLMYLKKSRWSKIIIFSAKK